MATVHQALRFALDPTFRQRRDLARHAGASRYAYNWGLARQKASIDARQAGETGIPLPSAIAQHKEWNRWKKGGMELQWQRLRKSQALTAPASPVPRGHHSRPTSQVAERW